MNKWGYKKRLVFLSVLTALLAASWIMTLVFESGRGSLRKAAYAWLPREAKDAADRIEISAARPEAGSPEKLELVRRNGVWRVFHDGAAYPAKEARVDDFLDALASRGAYPVRSSASPERLGLSEESASRITVRGGAGPPLLDLFVGNIDSSGRETYLRRAGGNEVRSGEDRFSGYIFSGRASWYDLAFIPEADADPAQVQRVTVRPPGGGPGEPLTLARSEGGWIISGVKNPDRPAAENYVRAVLGAGGEDFGGEDVQSRTFESGRLTVELGTGRIYTIRFGPPGESGRRPAAISVTGGSGVSGASPGCVYLVSEWTINRLFRPADFFESAASRP
ncbi:MAG: DUF4340 domain-containing protein [Treponema sp.]|jgi:hypothetical protein|nr:DUF4340 domain-containing protein [Treponema sp.]